MASDNLKDLESFDLMSLTVADLANLKNDVLRRALISVIETSVASEATHTNHWAFQSHLKAVREELSFETLQSERK